MNKLILLAALLVQTPVFAADIDASKIKLPPCAAQLAVDVKTFVRPIGTLYYWRTPAGVLCTVAARPEWLPAPLTTLQIKAGYDGEARTFMRAEIDALTSAPK